MTAHAPRDVVALFGLPFDIGDTEEVASRLRRIALAGERCWLSTANLDWLLMAREDQAFRRAALDSDMLTMDGGPVAALARGAGVAGASRVAGADLFEALAAPTQERPLRVFFFGGRDGAAETATERLRENARAGAGLAPAGYLNPGYGDVSAMSAPDTLARINDSGADLLIVSLGAAKGQAWIARNRHALTAPIVSHLGAVVDFTAGTIARAPSVVQRVGAEWAWRIGQDPALWRRYARDAAALPGLLAEARTLRALTSAQDAAGGEGSLQHDRTCGTLRVTGPAPTDQLREALSTARRVVLAEDARPSLRALGVLLLAREEARREGRTLLVEGEGPRAARLVAASLGPQEG